MSIQNSTLIIRDFTAFLFLSSCLVGCGGGGGSTSTSSSYANNQSNSSLITTSSSTSASASAPTATTNTALTANLVINADDSPEVAALNFLNKNRQACGFSSLTQNSALNVTAANHANYMVLVTESNKYPYASHYEKSESFTDGTSLANTGITNDYYSGFELATRLKPTTLGSKTTPTNYDAKAQGENIALTNLETSFSTHASDPIANAQNMLKGLFAAPYHLRTLVFPQFSEAGVKYKETQWTANGKYNFTNLLEIVSALPNTQIFNNNTKLLNFPCDGVTTAYQLTDESPNPFGNSRDLAKQPIGQPIYVLAPYDKTIENANATYTLNGVSVGTIHVLTSSKDPNQLLKNNEVIFMPDLPLKPNSSYQVNYQLTYSDGQKVEKQFTFSTDAK